MHLTPDVRRAPLDIAMPPPIEASTQDPVPLLCDCRGRKPSIVLASVPEECRRNIAEIERAIAEGSLAASKRAAHRLKGMAGNLGAVRLAQTARDIELKSESIDDVASRMASLQETLTGTLAALQSAGHNR